MAFVVVYDACVLYPAPLRDLLIRLARTGKFRAKWTEEILDECFEAIVESRSDLDPKALARTRELMVRAVPDSLVSGYEPLIAGIELPDSGDRHVVAAAIRAGAQVIVTTNLKDFPAKVLEKFDLVAQHPDEFVSHVIDLAPGAVCKVVVEQAAALKNPPVTTDGVLDLLEQQGLPLSVAELRTLIK